MLKNKPRVILNQETPYSISRDCDCACCVVSNTQKRQTESIWNSDMRIAPSFYSRSLPNSNWVIAAPTNHANQGIAVCNDSAWDILSAFRKPFNKRLLVKWYRYWDPKIVDTVLKKFVSLGILISPEKLSIPIVEDPHMLGAWLHITDRCNLRCSYCYLPHSLSEMSRDTGRRAIDSVFNSALAHNYRKIKLKYAGGEPLLRYPLVADLHRYATAMAEQHNLVLDGVVLSNGTLLTKDIVRSMKHLGLRLMISLDGIGAAHDRQRAYLNGQGSFKDVLQAVEMALDHELVPDISITVTQRNADYLPQLIEWVLGRELPFSLNFYREHEASASQADLQLEEGRIIAGMMAAYQVIEQNLPSYSLLSSLTDRANLSAPHLRPCSVGNSYLVFDTQGRVAKCQMDMSTTVTDVRNPDPLKCIRETEIGIQNTSVDEKSECRDCQWRYWCAGGCALQTYRATGRYDARSPYCNIYRALYPEVIRLEGLRLLQHAELESCSQEAIQGV